MAAGDAFLRIYEDNPDQEEESDWEETDFTFLGDWTTYDCMEELNYQSKYNQRHGDHDKKLVARIMKHLAARSHALKESGGFFLHG